MAGIPKQYAFLSAVGVLPRVITHGLSLLGTNEIPGKRGSNDVIEAWADEVNKGGVTIVGYSDDAIPWCGLFAAVVVLRAGKRPVQNPLWARNWAVFDQAIGVNAGTNGSPRLISSGFPKPVGNTAPSLGDVLVFVRDGGGHVGFYIAEDDTAFHVLGGNQSDSVTITRVARVRCIGVRRPNMTVPPASLRPYKIVASGAVSMNEA